MLDAVTAPHAEEKITLKTAIYHAIPYLNPIEILGLLPHENLVFLDTVAPTDESSRYSFIGTEPFLTFISKHDKTWLNGELVRGNPFDILKKTLRNYPTERHPNLPIFQGGAAGYFAYDLCHHLENIPRHPLDELAFPDLALGFYDTVIAFDHLEQQAWIFSNGYPELEPAKRRQRAHDRIDQLQKIIQKKTTVGASPCGRLNCENITSNFESENYQAMVRKIIEHITAGDIFQANVSQRFSTKIDCNIDTDYTKMYFDLYKNLRTFNPASFAAYVCFGNTRLLSVSPERFLQLIDQQVETSPIKGTRPRSTNLEEDDRLAQELQSSEKDHAENVMIVDLMRNDLARVCQPHTIQVKALCQLKTFPTVHHLVSTISGKLRLEYDAIDLLKATFPGGSVTGAPKIRAMHLIAQYETTARGPYCGSIGYIGFDGSMDVSITIRTFAAQNNHLTFQAGGGIVADSNPLTEYAETLVKIAALKHVIDSN